MDPQSLDAIGILEGTDKTSLVQDYLRHYELIFGGLRNEPLQLLEIGISRGASLRMWTKFFTRALIIGVDIDEGCRAFANDRIKVEIGSQADPEFLVHLARRYQPDIIIDDGSHQASHIVLTFERLFSFLQSGGYYIIEDIYLHYGEDAAHWHRSGGITAVEYFARIASRLSADHLDPDCGPFEHYLASAIDGVEFVRKAVILRKNSRQVDQAQRLTDLWTLTEKSGHASNWNDLALMLLRKNELDRAEIASRHAVMLAPANADFLLRLSHILSERGHVPEAIKTMRRLIVLVPDHPAFRSSLAELEGRLTKTDHQVERPVEQPVQRPVERRANRPAERKAESKPKRPRETSG